MAMTPGELIRGMRPVVVTQLFGPNQARYLPRVRFYPEDLVRRRRRVHAHIPYVCVCAFELSSRLKSQLGHRVVANGIHRTEVRVGEG